MALVINDFNLRIINLVVGFLGSIYDSRVMKRHFIN